MAIKMHDPIGEATWGGLFLRIPLGAYFVLAGLTKLKDPTLFVEEVRKMGVVPEHVGTIYAVLLPYLEIGSGGLLVLGAWTTLAAACASILLASFIFALGVYPHGRPLFNKDFILLGGALALLFTGGGAYSIDKFRKGA
jgi:uncharacterized membrane protein YphA (DoxX/SURF4 family)